MTDTPGAPSVRAFLASEARAFARMFVRTLLFAAGALTALWAVVVAASAVSAERDEDVGVGALAIASLVYIAMSLPTTLTLGAALGAMRVLWRAAGAFAFVPFIAIPLGALLALWLAVPALRDGLSDVVTAITSTFAERGMPASERVLEGGRVAHAGGPAAVIVLAILLPFLILDLLAVLMAPSVLWAIFVVIATAAFAASAGALVFGTPALGVALWAFIVRTRRRWKEHAATAAPQQA